MEFLEFFTAIIDFASPYNLGLMAFAMTLGIVVGALDGQGGVTIPVAQQDVDALALSPGGEVLALGVADGEITLWNAATGEKMATDLRYAVPGSDAPGTLALVDARGASEGPAPVVFAVKASRDEPRWFLVCVAVPVGRPTGNATQTPGIGVGVSGGRGAATGRTARRCGPGGSSSPSRGRSSP